MISPIAKEGYSFQLIMRGRFTLLDSEGYDRTPVNRKERAILALLASSKDRRRSREWLKAILWSESEPKKAANSLRTAIKNLRKAFALGPDLIETNRLEVWLHPDVAIDDHYDGDGTEEYLDLIDAPDPAFENWLRDTRARRAALESSSFSGVSNRVYPQIQEKSGTIVVIRPSQFQVCAEGAFLEVMLIDTLSSRFTSEGADEVFAQSDPPAERIERAASTIFIELACVVENGHWSVHLRALADDERRFIWAGRHRHAIGLDLFESGTEVHAFVSRALTQISQRYHSFRHVRRSQMMIMSRAVSRLYDPSVERVRAAQEDLEALTAGDGASIALAWLSFARLARQLEFGDLGVEEEAFGLISEALKKTDGNALVSALASRVALDLSSDLDRAERLAQLALQNDDSNPYALQAASRVALSKGLVDEAQAYATKARRSADGLPHVFAWDFELCLTALARGDFAAAQDAVRQAYRHNSRHRASLRYLVATSVLVGDRFEAEHAASRLAGLEQGFKISDLRREDYPVLTLRNLDLIGLLSDF